MKLQKSLLIIPAALALVWGVFDLFAPGLVYKFLNTPAEMINPELTATLSLFGVGQISLGIIALWMRSISDKKMMTGAMTVIAAVFLMFGLHGVLSDFFIADSVRNMVVFIQGIVMILLAVIFFVKRKAD
jgi:uncharacterized membrane protein